MNTNERNLQFFSHTISNQHFWLRIKKGKATEQKEKKQKTRKESIQSKNNPNTK